MRSNLHLWISSCTITSVINTRAITIVLTYMYWFTLSLNIITTALDQSTDLEEGHGGAAVHGSVLDVGLSGQVVCALDVHRHALDGQEGGQVSGVGGDDDECEEPPDGADEARRGGTGHQVTTCRGQQRSSRLEVNEVIAFNACVTYSFFPCPYLVFFYLSCHVFEPHPWFANWAKIYSSDVHCTFSVHFLNERRIVRYCVRVHVGYFSFTLC